MTLIRFYFKLCLGLCVKNILTLRHQGTVLFTYHELCVLAFIAVLGDPCDTKKIYQ